MSLFKDSFFTRTGGKGGIINNKKPQKTKKHIPGVNKTHKKIQRYGPGKFSVPKHPVQETKKAVRNQRRVRFGDNTVHNYTVFDIARFSNDILQTRATGPITFDIFAGALKNAFTRELDFAVVNRDLLSSMKYAIRKFREYNLDNADPNIKINALNDMNSIYSQLKHSYEMMKTRFVHNISQYEPENINMKILHQVLIDSNDIPLNIRTVDFTMLSSVMYDFIQLQRNKDTRKKLNQAQAEVERAQAELTRAQAELTLAQESHDKHKERIKRVSILLQKLCLYRFYINMVDGPLTLTPERFDKALEDTYYILFKEKSRAKGEAIKDFANLITSLQIGDVNYGGGYIIERSYLNKMQYLYEQMINQ